MNRRTRTAPAWAVMVVALTGGGVATAGEAQASAAAALVPAELRGVCGTLFGAGVNVASFGRTIVARGAGYAGAIVSAGCLLKDGWEYQQAWYATPEGRSAYRELQASYGHFDAGQLMHGFGCAEIAVPPVAADGISTYGGITWDCSGSQYAKAD